MLAIGGATCSRWRPPRASGTTSRYPSSQSFALGALFAGGHDVPEDRVAALRWFRAAAELGHGQAQLMLGRYLAEGVDGEPDPVEASNWLEQAAAQGIEEAQADLAALPAQ